MHNWSYWHENLLQQALLGYTEVLGFFVYPIMFSAIIGYIYMKNQSAVAGAVAILIIFASFGNVFLGVDPWYSLMQILVALSVTALILMFITKYRR